MYRTPFSSEKIGEGFLEGRGGGASVHRLRISGFRNLKSGRPYIERSVKFWLIEDFAYFLSVFSPNEDDSGYYVEEDPEFDDEINEEFEKFLQEQEGLFNWNCEGITVDIPSVDCQ